MTEFSPYISRPSGEALVHTAPDGYTASHWDAQPSQLGKIELVHNVIHSPIGKPAQGHFALEADYYANTSLQSSTMHSYHLYMGVSSGVQQAPNGDRFIELTYPHPQTMIDKLATLPVETTNFAVFDGTEFPLRALTAELADQGRMLIANQAESMAHDVLTHALPTWALIPPIALESIVDIAQYAQEKGERPAETIARQIEGTMSSLALGKDIASALRAEETGIYASGEWESAAFQINMLTGQREKVSPGVLRDHVIAVTDAAANNL